MKAKSLQKILKEVLQEKSKWDGNYGLHTQKKQNKKIESIGKSK